jgi:hypothetical protein
VAIFVIWSMDRSLRSSRQELSWMSSNRFAASFDIVFSTAASAAGTTPEIEVTTPSGRLPATARQVP